MALRATLEAAGHIFLLGTCSSPDSRDARLSQGSSCPPGCLFSPPGWHISLHLEIRLIEQPRTQPCPSHSTCFPSSSLLLLSSLTSSSSPMPLNTLFKLTDHHLLYGFWTPGGHPLTPQHLNAYITISSPTCSKQEFWLPYPLSKLPPILYSLWKAISLNQLHCGKQKHHAQFSLFSHCAHSVHHRVHHLCLRGASRIRPLLSISTAPVIQGPSPAFKLLPGPLHKLPGFHSTTYLLQSILCPAASETFKKSNATLHC